MAAPTSRHFRPDQPLFHEGEASRSMFLIQKGIVSIRKMKGGGQIEIARIFAGEVIGELSFFDRSPRSASAVAITEVEVLEIGFDGLDKIYANVPDYMKTIMASVAERLRRANDMIRRLQKDTVEESSPQVGSGEFSATDALAAAQAIESGEDPLIDLPDDLDVDFGSDFPVTDPEKRKR